MQAVRSYPPPALPAVGIAHQELLSLQRDVLLGGRWVLFLAEVAAVLLRHHQIERNPRAEFAALGLVIYNAATLILLRRVPTERFPGKWLLAADVAAVGALIVFTRGLASPFASLAFLISLFGAVYYNLAGGLSVAAAMGAIMFAATRLYPEIWVEVIRDQQRTQLLPYLVLHGGIAGYLVGRLKQLHERRVEAEERLRRAEYDEQIRRREAAVAREIQLATLRQPPQPAWVETAVRFEPAQEVGGDFYSFLTDDGRFAVVVGDVSGKGMPAALVSTTISHLSHCLPALSDPAHFLADLNLQLLDRLPDWTLATLALALVELRAQRVVLYNAGHPPPYVIRGGCPQRMPNGDLPLGVAEVAPCAPLAVPFRPGDTLLLYSDGFLDTRDHDGRHLRPERFEERLRRHTGLPVEETAGRLLADTRASGAVEDDLTLVIVRLRGG